VLVGAVALILTACGSSDPDGTALPPPSAATSDTTAPETTSAESTGGSTADSTGTDPTAPGSTEGSLPPGSPPPTTTPLPVAPLTCGESVVTIAERVLIERRQRTPAGDCMGSDALPPAGAPGPICWDRCADGRAFADFVLDPAAVPEAATGSVAVPYAARYVDATGVESTEAETLLFERSGDGWVLTAVSPTDLGDERNRALDVIGDYLGAIAAGDHRRAAQLLLGTAPAAPIERDDLGRLADEGLLAGGGVDDVARAVEAWCSSGAVCRLPDGLRTEVTPRHTVRVVATYEVDGREYDVVFTVGASGADEVFGLPPRP
jgi:hypothetical protein